MSFNCEREVTNKKPHKCFGCGRVFGIGWKMRDMAWHWDGDFGHGRICPTCQYIVDHPDFDNDDGYEQGSLFSEAVQIERDAVKLDLQEKTCIYIV